MKSFQTKISEDVGYIRAKVERIDILEKKMEVFDKRFDGIEKKISHILGWASGAGAVAGVVFVLIREWFKKLL